MGRIGKGANSNIISCYYSIVGKALITPIGEFGAPTEAYSAPLFKGFIDGYLTLDGLATGIRKCCNSCVKKKRHYK